MTPEGKVKAKVRAVLKEHGAYFFFPVQTGYGAPTLDILGCHNGRFFAIETKAPGKKPTPRQYQTIEWMTKARGKVFVIDGNEKVLHELNTWLVETGESISIPCTE